MELPVEGQPHQLALQLNRDVSVLLARQGDLGLAVGLPVTSCQAGLSHLTQVGEERLHLGPQTSVQLLGARDPDRSVKRSERSLRMTAASNRYLRSPLDGGGVHPLLPHTAPVRQQEAVRRLPEAALGEQPAAADAHGEPGALQEGVGSSGLHHRHAEQKNRGQLAI